MYDVVGPRRSESLTTLSEDLRVDITVEFPLGDLPTHGLKSCLIRVSLWTSTDQDREVILLTYQGPWLLIFVSTEINDSAGYWLTPWNTKDGGGETQEKFFFQRWTVCDGVGPLVPIVVITFHYTSRTRELTALRSPWNGEVLCIEVRSVLFLWSVYSYVPVGCCRDCHEEF